MQYREIMAVYCINHTEHVYSTFCVQDKDFLDLTVMCNIK
jgi:hypothetical protein